jgi:benzoyl-CoA-dihydrodiol lyase
MNAVLEKTAPESRRPTLYDTRPDKYVHWRLSCDGAVATLSMDVNEEKGLRPATN